MAQQQIANIEDLVGKPLNQIDDLKGIRRQQKSGGKMYTMGGGSIGDVWRWDATPVMDQTTGKTKPKGFVLKPQFKAVSRGSENLWDYNDKRKKINIIPAGMGGRQEYQWMKGGGDWVEAPKEYTYKTEQETGKRGGGGFYDTSGNKFSGTLMGTGSYRGFGGGGAQTSQRSWSNYAGDKPIRGMVGTNFYEDSSVWSREGTGVPQRVGPRNPEYGSNPAKTREAMMPPSAPTASSANQNIVGFTGFGQMSGVFPQQTMLSTTPTQKQNPQTPYIPSYISSNYGEAYTTNRTEPTPPAVSPFINKDLEGMGGYGGLQSMRFPFAGQY